MSLDYIICLQSQSGERDWSSTLGMIGQFFLLIIVFGVILFLAYFSTKWIASARMGARNNSVLKLISSMPVGSGNSIQLIKVGEKYFLIGVSKENVTYITEVDNDDIPSDNIEKPKFSFEKYFRECYNKFKTNDVKESGKKYKK